VKGKKISARDEAKKSRAWGGSTGKSGRRRRRKRGKKNTHHKAEKKMKLDFYMVTRSSNILKQWQSHPRAAAMWGKQETAHAHQIKQENREKRKDWGCAPNQHRCERKGRKGWRTGMVGEKTRMRKLENHNTNQATSMVACAAVCTPSRGGKKEEKKEKTYRMVVRNN